jgi:hypothetical protein
LFLTSTFLCLTASFSSCHSARVTSDVQMCLDVLSDPEFHVEEQASLYTNHQSQVSLHHNVHINSIDHQHSQGFNLQTVEHDPVYPDID